MDPNARRQKKPMADVGYSTKPLVALTVFLGFLFTGGTWFLLQETYDSSLYAKANYIVRLPGKASLESNIKAQENGQRTSPDVNRGRVPEIYFSETQGNSQRAAGTLPTIRGTPLKGKPVESFRAYLDCFRFNSISFRCSFFYKMLLVLCRCFSLCKMLLVLVLVRCFSLFLFLEDIFFQIDENISPIAFFHFEPGNIISVKKLRIDLTIL